jgi:anti-anti-sigma regulatory factor
MPGCSLAREVNGSTALYRIAGRFEGSCAWDLTARLGDEPLLEVVIDFSQVTDFVDSAIAVVATSLASSGHRVRLHGLRQHQERLFRYFGVEPAEPAPDLPHLPPELAAAAAATEVA